MNTILQIAKNNEYPERLINKLNTKIKTTTSIHNIPKIKTNNKKWAIFEYSNPVIRKVTNIFKNTDVKISFRPCNISKNIYRTLQETNNTYSNSGIYSLQCNTCKRHYVGQTGRDLASRCTEHTRYIKNNDPKSAYALHILNNRHEFGPLIDTMNLLKPCKKGRNMTTLENLYMQSFHRQGMLIDEQNVTNNRLFQLLDTPTIHHSYRNPNTTAVTSHTWPWKDRTDAQLHTR